MSQLPTPQSQLHNKLPGQNLTQVNAAAHAMAGKMFTDSKIGMMILNNYFTTTTTRAGMSPPRKQATLIIVSDSDSSQNSQQGSKFRSSDRMRRVKMTLGQVKCLQQLSVGRVCFSDKTSSLLNPHLSLECLHASSIKIRVKAASMLQIFSLWCLPFPILDVLSLDWMSGMCAIALQLGVHAWHAIEDRRKFRLWSYVSGCKSWLPTVISLDRIKQILSFLNIESRGAIMLAKSSKITAFFRSHFSNALEQVCNA